MIAVVSDSHVPGRAEKIPEEFREKMKEADLIVHAGDFAEKEVYNGIDEYGDLIAVKGNCDFFELPNSETFTRNSVDYGVYHGTGITPRGDHKTLEKIGSEDLEAEILITGHTHKEEITELEKCIILNPGSCTGVGGGTSRESKPTMIQIEEENSEGEIKVELLEKNSGQVKTKKEEKIEI
jgi:putative phosphoesterase